MKLCIAVAAHCPPGVLRLTIGSFIRALKPGYELDIHVGLHSNYQDYCRDLSIFNDLSGIASVHLVDEIDWMGPDYNACIYRYSIMHAKNLINILKHIQHTDFDYLIILDHDLNFKNDVVSYSINKYPNAELIGTLFEDKITPWWTTTVLDNRQIIVMPKMSIWHLMISKQGFKRIVDNIDEIYPIEIFHPPTVAEHLRQYGQAPNSSIFFDTFARVYHRFLINNIQMGIIRSDEFMSMVEHFYKSSFNYGQKNMGAESYDIHIRNILEKSHAEFPKGLDEFRRKITT